MTEEPMTDPTATTTTRRQVLRTGAAGAAAAFLAACTKARKEGGPKPGQSGTPVTTTSEAPKVPTTQPSAEALLADTTQWRTAASLELVVANAYATFGADIDDADWKAAATQYQADHEAAAKVFQDGTKPAAAAYTKPNAYVQTNVIDPVAGDLPQAADAEILDFFRGLESMLVATYVTAAGTFTDPAWRQTVMEFGSASARRVGTMSNDGAGAVSDGPLYPVSDLIAAEAYLSTEKKKAGA